MNKLLVGNDDFTQRLLQTRQPFLLIDDGPIADAFLKHFPKAKPFDISKDSFNPLKGIDHKRARELSSTIYTADPGGKDTLTVRNGKRALTRLFLSSTRLDRLKTDNSPATTEAIDTINDLLLSPVLKSVLCNPTNFSFKGSVVLKLDRAALGELDTFILASLLVTQFKGQIIVSDFDFYGRDFYMSLIRQNRLTAVVHSLGQLSPVLRTALLMVRDKSYGHCTYDDAVVLAQYERLTPGQTKHTDFVERLVA